MTKTKKLSTLIALSLALLPAGIASAQSPADTVYNPSNGVLDVVASATPTPTPKPTTGTAPETATATPKTPSTSTSPATTTPAATATPAAQTERASTGSLPFTGFEAGFVALAGLALLGGGIAMRRLSRNA